mmetsp:Transcript_33723/g.39657  ORF Transcript_33723/g.39657 Transcript_33723/m.39657 type:complete len:86 (+) Transcript_33723:303-560(+)
MTKVGNPSNPATMFEIDMPPTPDPDKKLEKKLMEKKTELRQLDKQFEKERKKNEQLAKALDKQKALTMKKEAELQREYQETQLKD